MDKQIDTVAAKQRLRDQIKRDTEKFLKAGNKIEVVK